VIRPAWAATRCWAGWGLGGMGQVFLGVSPSGRRVAVKLIHPVHAGEDHFRERFVLAISDQNGNVYIRVTSQLLA